MVEWFDWLLAFTVPTVPTLFHLKNTVVSVRMVVYLVLLLQLWSFMTSLHPLNILNYAECTGGTLLFKWPDLINAYLVLQFSQLYLYLGLVIPGQFYVYVGKVSLALFVLYHAQVYPRRVGGGKEGEEEEDQQHSDSGVKDTLNHFTKLELDYLVKYWLPSAIIVIDRKLQSRWDTAWLVFYDCGMLRLAGHLAFASMIFAQLANNPALNVTSQIALIAGFVLLGLRHEKFK